MKNKIIIGRKDKADFPEFGLKDINIKMDTGAYTSAIHCHNMDTKIVDGKEILVFTLLDPSHPEYDGMELSTDTFREKRVKNSFGISEKRFVIKTKISLFGKKYKLELSLSKRAEMRFPVLIGRRFLMGKFIVDSSLYDLSYTQNKNKII